MATVIALPGFNYLERSVNPNFLLMDYFLYRFSTFNEKNEESQSNKSFFIFAKCTIKFRFLAFRLSVLRF